MKKLIWKLRYTIEFRRLVRAPWRMCWQHADAALTDIFNGDPSECDPITAAEEERDEWLACC